MGDYPNWGDGHSRAVVAALRDSSKGSNHAGVTVVAAPSGITSTESTLPQHSMPHEFGGAKRERHLDKVSATSRTAEVTICINSERLLDRPRQLPHE